MGHRRRDGSGDVRLAVRSWSSATVGCAHSARAACQPAAALARSAVAGACAHGFPPTPEQLTEHHVERSDTPCWTRSGRTLERLPGYVQLYGTSVASRFDNDETSATVCLAPLSQLLAPVRRIPAQFAKCLKAFPAPLRSALMHGSLWTPLTGRSTALWCSSRTGDTHADTCCCASRAALSVVCSLIPPA